MPPRRAAQPVVTSPENGDLSTYSRFKDRLTLLLIAMVLGLIGFIVQDQVRGKGQAAIVVDNRINNVESDLRQFKDRVNAQFDERLRMLSDHAERLKAVETEMRASRSEIVGRLDRIEAKIDAR